MGMSITEKRLYKLHLKEYLGELEKLVGHPISESELIGVAETRDIQVASKKFEHLPTVSKTVPFLAADHAFLGEVLQQLSDANNSPVFIWTPRTQYCGMLKIPSICAIKPDFHYQTNKEGVLAFITDDLCDRMVIDWSNDGNTNWLTYEFQGDNWGCTV